MFYKKFEKILRMKISAVIIAFNEENNIEKAIQSVLWADEILLIDSGSTDKTCQIAEKLGAKVIVQEWLGFSKQKQFGVKNASYDWIFSLDADEQVSDQLRLEILNLRKSEKDLPTGFKIPRLSYYMNRPIRRSGWYPDWQIRFFNRQNANWKDVIIHESVEVNGEIGKLKGDILHFSIENASHHHRMIGERYAPLSAKQMFENGRKTTPLTIISIGFITFFQSYILKAGFLDGLPGFCISSFAAHHAFLKNLMLWELQNRSSRSEN
jgi:glycosyltransferase involved in cell wall biosynthesis